MKNICAYQLNTGMAVDAELEIPPTGVLQRIKIIIRTAPSPEMMIAMIAQGYQVFVVHPHDAPAFNLMDGIRVNTANSFEVDAQLSDDDNRGVFLQTTNTTTLVRVIAKQNTDIIVVATVRDITEVKRFYGEFRTYSTIRR